MNLRQWKHDLKTPLLAQKVAIRELLTERPGKLSETQRIFLESILQANSDFEQSIVEFVEGLEKTN